MRGLRRLYISSTNLRDSIRLGKFVSIHNNAQIGENCEIQSNTSIGT